MRWKPSKGVHFTALMADLVLIGAAFGGFFKLRNDEGSRKFMHQHLPTLLNGYYWLEDKVSTQLKGSRLKQSDLNRWLRAIDGSSEPPSNSPDVPTKQAQVDTDDDDEDEDDD